MVPFGDPRLERALEHVADGMSFDVTEHDVVLRGPCDRCAA
jgi:Fe2+ or Zn2+ uptake regulation protein